MTCITGWPTRASAERNSRWLPRTGPPPTRPPPKPIPLWRFVLVATAIVVAVGSIAFARRGGPPDVRISARVNGTPTPTAEQPAASPAPGASTSFLGSGSWTMSSLPACFRERERIRGATDRLRVKFPPAHQRVRPATVVRIGDCSIVVGEHDLWIARGNDRLRVPPEAALYRDATGLTLVYVDGSRAEIRRY